MTIGSQETAHGRGYYFLNTKEQANGWQCE